MSRDALTTAPSQECPSCHELISLRELNRDTGGCRCRSCGWVTEAIPAAQFDGKIRLGDLGKGFVEAAISAALQRSEHMTTDADICITIVPTGLARHSGHACVNLMVGP